VPCIVDTRDGKVVTNDFSQITLDFSTEWTDYHRPGAPQLLPTDFDKSWEMTELMRRIYTDVNNGVYRAGFAGSQEAYDAAFAQLFASLDWLENHLASRRFLLGPSISEADVRLFTTLVRFDAVYYSHFKCNRNLLTAMPNLWAYARDLFQLPGFGDTVDFEQIKQHYYIVHKDINPSGIVPKGPLLDDWLEPTTRDRLSDDPWGGGTAPAPVREGERVTAGHNPLYSEKVPTWSVLEQPPR